MQSLPNSMYYRQWNSNEIVYFLFVFNLCAKTHLDIFISIHSNIKIFSRQFEIRFSEHWLMYIVHNWMSYFRYGYKIDKCIKMCCPRDALTHMFL